MTNVSTTTGMPRRLQSQLNTLNKLGNGRYTGEVLEQYPSISTARIKEIETRYVQEYWNAHKAKFGYGAYPPANMNHPGIIK